jgi:hypothetical protein
MLNAGGIVFTYIEGENTFGPLWGPRRGSSTLANEGSEIIIPNPLSNSKNK